MTPPPIDEYAFAERVDPWLFDRLLATGWRHFGTVFFRYNRSEGEDGQGLTVQPLRLELTRYFPNKSQRRCLRRNADLTLSIAPARITPECAAMFDAHKQRFRSNVPERLEDFLGEEPGSVVPCLSFTVARDGVPVNIDREAVYGRARQLAASLWRRMRG